MEVITPSRLVLQNSAPDIESTEREPTTPSDWFSLRFPVAAQKYGPPILEAHTIDHQGFLNIDCVQPNEDFFAAVLGGEDKNTKLVYYLPEHCFYHYDRTLDYFTPTTEGRLRLILSQLFIQCATYLSHNRPFVRIGKLFQEFRSQKTLTLILERAKGMLAVDQTFFDAYTGNKKSPAELAPEQTAHIFIVEAFKPEKGQVLSLGDAYEKYVDFCQHKNMPVRLIRREFRSPAIEAVKATFGKTLRKDLKVEGKWTVGWRDLTATVINA